MHHSICFSFILIMVSNFSCDTLGDASFKEYLCISGIQELQSQFCPPCGSLYVNGFCFRLYWQRIAAAAAAAFRGGRGFPHRGGNGFPKHARRFILRFNNVRTLWTLPVIHHCRFWRFGTRIIEFFFFRAQRGTVIHISRVVTMNLVHKSFVTIWCVLEYSVMALALQYQEHQ